MRPWVSERARELGEGLLGKAPARLLGVGLEPREGQGLEALGGNGLSIRRRPVDDGGGDLGLRDRAPRPLPRPNCLAIRPALPRPLDQLGGQGLVALGADAGRIVEAYGLAVRGSLGEADVPRDDRPENLVLEVLGDLLDDFLGELGARVVHRKEDAADLEGGIHALLHEADGLKDEREALQGEVLALKRNEDLVGGDEAVERQYAEGGRAIDEDEVVLALDGREGALQVLVSVVLIDELDGGAGEVDRGGRQVEPFDRRRLDVSP